MTEAIDHTSADARVGTLLSDRYRIDAKLGEGGMGVVYRAEHVAIKKAVAVKVLHRQMLTNEEVVRRFEREAVAAGQIEHPNVASATDFGRLDDGSFFLVLEYVAGRRLTSVLEEAGALDVPRALSIARQVAAALGAAHRQGIVHRDLKPDNIMLLEGAEGGEQVKVLDFGIAKVTSDATQLTQLGAVFGTPQYMAPEQAAGRSVDARADLYALGLILDEMLRGGPTFDADQAIVLLTLQMTQPPPPLPRHVPQAVAELVLALLDKSPDQRPGSADQVVSNINGLLGRAAPEEASIPAHTLAARMTAGAARGWQRAWSFLSPLLSRAREARIRGIPAWLLAAPAVLLLFIVFAWPSDEVAVPGPPKDARPEPSLWQQLAGDKAAQAEVRPTEERGSDDADLERLIPLARRGSEAAVRILEQRDPDERSSREWMALAIGRLRLRRVGSALDAYEAALELDQGLAADKTILGGLRYFGGKDESADAVLEFAAKHLAHHGADLLFHVWSSTSRKTRATVKAKELLDSDPVRSSMSKALALALALRDAQSCEDYKRLMPALEQAGDERSMIPMRKLAKTRGCGSSGKSDCYPCLRTDSEFKDALTQVAMRNAPRYEWRR